MRPARRAWIGAICVASSLGCSLARPPITLTPAAKEGEGRPFQLATPIEGTSPRDAIVRVVAKGNVTCTATLIADDRALTAHHCVSARDSRGRVLERDMGPEDVQVEIGREDFPWAEVKVHAIVAPKCGYIDGDGDIAILVLERHLVGMPTVAVQIDAPPKMGEAIHVHGYGRCALPTESPCVREEATVEEEQPSKMKKPAAAGAKTEPKHETALCTDAIHLRNREAENIGAVGPLAFAALAEMCPGDSGGPVYGSSEHLIGVVSAAVMDGLEKTKGYSVFTRLDVWAPLFSAAEEVSKGASMSELPPLECHAPAAKPRPR